MELDTVTLRVFRQRLRGVCVDEAVPNCCRHEVLAARLMAPDGLFSSLQKQSQRQRSYWRRRLVRGACVEFSFTFEYDDPFKVYISSGGWVGLHEV